jgi:hypothetical protein
MSSVIAENRPHEFLSIKHIGTVTDGVEDTESEAVRRWAPAFENYSFSETGSSTQLSVDIEVDEEWEADMTDAFPRALQKLKSICESRMSAAK